MGAVHRDGDFSIKVGNLGVVKKISINILKIKSVEEFYCCIRALYITRPGSKTSSASFPKQ